MTSDKPLRLFVAIAVPKPVQDEMAAAQRELQALAPHGVVRWTKPEQIHLTLKFLGDVAVSRVEELKGAVQMAVTSREELILSASGIGFFPNARSPRVIWAGFGDRTGRLADLQQEIERAVRPFTAEPMAEDFVGHLTLGRVKNPRHPAIGDLENGALAMENRQFGGWTAGGVKIIRSELSPDGARHTPVAFFPFRASLTR